MSWLNKSLSNITGQISNFANEVLSEGIVDDTDPYTELTAANQKIRDLQKLCDTKDVIIKNLQRDTAAFQAELNNPDSSKKTDGNVLSKQTHSKEEDGSFWFWDPPEEKASQEISPNQNHHQRLLAHIEELQAEISYLKSQQETPSSEAGLPVADRSDDSTKESQSEPFLDSGRMIKLSNENEVLDRDNKLLSLNVELLSAKITQLTDEREVTVAEMNDIHEQLRDELSIMHHNFDNLEKKHNSLTDRLDKKIQEENADLNEENFRLLEECTRLQHSLEELEKSIRTQPPANELGSPEKEEDTLAGSLVDSHSEKVPAPLNSEIDHLKSELASSPDSELVETKSVISSIWKMLDKYVTFEITGANKNNQNLTHELVDYTERCLKAFADCKTKNEANEKKISENSRVINNLQMSIYEMNSEMDLLNGELSHYEHKSSELKKNNDFLISEIGALKNVSKLEPISEQNEENIIKLQQELDFSSNLNKSLEEKLEKNIVELQKTQDLSEKYKTDLDRIVCEQVQRETSDEVNSIGSPDKVNQLQLEIQKLKSNLNSVSAEREKSKIDLSIADNEKIILQKEINELRANIQAKSLVEDYAKKVDELITQLDQKENKIQDLQGKVDLHSNVNAELQEKTGVINLLENEMLEYKDLLSATKSSLKEKEESVANSQEIINCMESEIKIQLKLLSDTDHTSQLEKSILTYASNNLNTSSPSDLKQSGENICQLYESQMAETSKRFKQLEEEIKTIHDENTTIKSKSEYIMEENAKLELLLSEGASNEDMNKKILEKVNDVKSKYESQIEVLTAENNNLVHIITQKHEESVTYHTEIQRLSAISITQNDRYMQLQVLYNELIEKAKNPEEGADHPDISSVLKKFEDKCGELEDVLAQLKCSQEELEKLKEMNQFLIEKNEILGKNLIKEESYATQIAQEKSQTLEREQGLSRELERLRAHLIEVEETYTRESVLLETRCQEMQAQLTSTEEKHRHSSTLYTSNSVRANQEVETLRTQLRLLEKQRDDLQAQLGQTEDRNSRHLAALTNLQCVLEQFQMDRERDAEDITRQSRKELEALQGELATLAMHKADLEEKLLSSNSGLRAATRLSSQLVAKTAQVSEIKAQVAKLEDELALWKKKYTETVSNQQDKIDKSLVKNLLLGLIQTTNRRQGDTLQVWRLLSTVLDFDQVECERAGLGSGKPAASGGESLAQEFVRFLEKESRPATLPKLLTLDHSAKPPGPQLGFQLQPQPPSTASIVNSGAEEVSDSTTTNQTPALKTSYRSPFSNPDNSNDITQTRNSEGAILKNVLKDT